MEELVQRAKDGDKEAFTELVLRLENNMYKIAKIRLDNESNVEDAVQETILEAFKSIKKLKQNEYFKTWIVRILINKCNKIYKKNKKEQCIEEHEIAFQDCAIRDVDSRLDFYSLLEGLNDDEKMAIVLYYVEDFTNAEISHLLRQPISTVKNRIARARKKIEKRIGERYHGTI